MVLAGARTVSWTAGDLDAVKKLLLYAFGPLRRPRPQSDSGDGSSTG
jgi:hypothetical protein